MKVSPPKVPVVIAVRMGGMYPARVLLMISSPDEEMTVCPSCSVMVRTVGVGAAAELALAGNSVKVCESVVNVLSAVRAGIVTVSLPMMRTPDEETTFCPSGSVVVSTEGVTAAGFDERLDHTVTVERSVVVAVRLWVLAVRFPRVASEDEGSNTV